MQGLSQPLSSLSIDLNKLKPKEDALKVSEKKKRSENDSLLWRTLFHDTVVI